MTMMPYEPAALVHADDCPCHDCETCRDADAAIAASAARTARDMLAGLVVGFLLVTLLDWLAAGPGLGVMVGR